MTGEPDASDRHVAPRWETAAGTEDHWLEVDYNEGMTFPKYHAVVKWDGCVHLDDYNGVDPGNATRDEADYLHICELDKMIAMLTALKEKAREHFGEDWS